MLESLLAPTLGWAPEWPTAPMSARLWASLLERWKLQLDLAAAWEQGWQPESADHSASDRTLRLEEVPKWQCIQTVCSP